MEILIRVSRLEGKCWYGKEYRERWCAFIGKSLTKEVGAGFGFTMSEAVTNLMLCTEEEPIVSLDTLERITQRIVSPAQPMTQERIKTNE